MGRISLESVKLGTYLTLITGIGLLATGCSLGKNPSPSASPDIAQVRIWRIDQSNDPIKELQKNFEKDNANTQTSFTRKKAANYELASLASLAARQGPDIWSLPSDWLWDYQQQIYTLPDTLFNNPEKKENSVTKEAVKSLYPSGITDLITGTDGKVYGLPSSVDTLQLYYNGSLLSAALSDYRKATEGNRDEAEYAQVRQLLNKAPATWNDLIGQVRYVTQLEGDTLTRSTIAFGTADNIPDAADVLQLLMMQNGAQIVSTDRRNALFHIPDTTAAGGTVTPGQNALDFFTSFADPSRETYSWNPSMPPALDAFAQGKVAMVIAYSDFGKQLKVKYPKFRYTTSPVPQISASPLQEPVNLIKFNTETITKIADDPNKALSFLKLYTNVSTTSALAREAKLYSPYTDRIKTLNDPIGNQILTGKAVYKKQHQSFDAAFRQMVVDVTQNELGPAEALTAGAETINKLLSGVEDE